LRLTKKAKPKPGRDAKGHFKVQPAKQAVFLLAYSKAGNVSEAALHASISRRQHYEWIKDKAYQAAFEEANQIYNDSLRAEVRRRGRDGWEEPIVYQGQFQYVGKGKNRRIATVNKRSDLCLIFETKARMPDEYNRENVKHEVTGRIDLVERLIAARKRRKKPDDSGGS